MSDNWLHHADAAFVDLTAARTTPDQLGALEHLRDAQRNITEAIEALENIQQVIDDLEERTRRKRGL